MSIKVEKVHVGHLYNQITDEQELLDNLEAVLVSLGEEADTGEVVVYVDHPLPWLPDGAIVVLPSGRAVHVCVVSPWPDSPLARPYAGIAIALDGARDILMAGGSAEDAAAVATCLLCAYIGLSPQKAGSIHDTLLADILSWKEVIFAE